MTMVNSLLTFSIFKCFLEYNRIKDNPIPKAYLQLQQKVEAYNKIVKNEFLAVEDISNKEDGKLRYDMFVKAYNEKREGTWWNKRTDTI